MLKYEHIELLNLLYGIPIIIFGIIFYENWKKRAYKLFGEKQLVSKLTSSYSKRKALTKNILTILIFTFLIIGLSNPKIGTKMEEVKREGVDLIIAIDLSNSMLAEDIKPNRLERSKQAISRLIDKLTGDRIGLVVFAGDAYIQLPITTDYAAAKLFLSTVNTNIMPNQGTEIGKAIDLGIKSFDMKNDQSKAIIIITDGENHDENAIEKTKEAQKLGIFVHTLGMGLSKGGPIPIYNKSGIQIGYRKDNDGNTIVSKLNEELLQKIAIEGKGSYVRANNSKVGLSTLFSEINKMEKKEIGTMVFTEFKDRFQIFLALTLFLLFIDLILSKKKNLSNSTNLFKK
tara:strand:+ start:1897 stop:2928 length:1032 start_codon:yes stop_codon:yes gene_type:complete